MSRRPAALVASPVMIGTVTTLVVIVAVFLSYNANSGLPFVPTYDLTVQAPDARNLIRGNEVRIGGKRVGIVSAVDAVRGRGGRPVAEISVRLEQSVRPLLDDTTVTVRPRSPLGLKYLEVEPGRSGRPLEQASVLPLSAAQPTVELDEVLDAFDDGTRASLARTLDGLAAGTAGRGQGLNRTLAVAPSALRRGEIVGRTVSARETDLRGFLRGSDAVVRELHAEAPRLVPLVEAADDVAGALAGVRAEVGESIDELPPTLEAGERALAAARPVLADARALAAALRPGARLLPEASERLHSALEEGTPVVRRGLRLAADLRATLADVERLAANPLTLSAADRVLRALRELRPVVDVLVPAQTVCNQLGIGLRNLASVLSEGDASGTWVRTLPINAPGEANQSAGPAPELHANPYPNQGFGPDPECEAGREPYEEGRHIGNPPGNQGTSVERTSPPPGVAP